MTRLRQLGFKAQSVMNTVEKQKAEHVFFLLSQQAWQSLPAWKNREQKKKYIYIYF